MKHIRLSVIGVALALLAAGCAGPRLFDDRSHARSNDHGVSARWLDELYREEVRGRRSEVEGRPTEVGAAAATADEEPAITDESTLDGLLAFAIRNHPAVQAAYAEWIAMRERIVQARTLPDPQLSYGIMVEQVDRGSGGRDPIGHSFGVSQMFPWFGKLDARADVEIEAARAAYERMIAEQTRVVRDVKEAWAEYAYAAVSRGIVAQHRELLANVEEVVRIRYRGAEAGLADLLRVQQEGDQLDVELRDIDDVLRSLRARLNAAIGRPADAPLPEAAQSPSSSGRGVWGEGASGNMSADTLTPDPSPRGRGEFDPNENQVMRDLMRSNPQLRAQQAQIARRRQTMRLAQLDYYPDIMLGVEYGLNTARRMARMDGGGSDSLTGMISINLPLWREKYDAGVREALAEFGAATKTYADQRNILEADLRTALYRLREADRRIELFGDVLRARGEQVLEATLAAYRVGDASFTDLVQAQRELLTFELAHERALADRFARLAEIDALFGRVSGDLGYQREGTEP